MKFPRLVFSEARSRGEVPLAGQPQEGGIEPADVELDDRTTVAGDDSPLGAHLSETVLNGV